MNIAPIPVMLKPLFKTKPWGGRRLETHLGKSLPANDPIGESWEVVSLPENESIIRGGPLDGQTLSSIVDSWGSELLGDAKLADGRFPLLIKFLDACDHLSVQVHPKPDPQAGEWQPGIKHEAWYVVHAEPEAKLYIGLRDGVRPEDLRRVANTPEMVNVLRIWDGQPGQCYYLPSGTLHALGKGLLVAEVQTPSDITYRAYDWDRVGLDGNPRELHIDQTLENTRFDVTPEMIRQPEATIAGLVATGTRVAACEAFTMDLIRLPAGASCDVPRGRMAIWMMLKGSLTLTSDEHTCTLTVGDVGLLPAGGKAPIVSTDGKVELIEVMIP